MDLLVIWHVIAQQLSVGLCQLGSAHPHVALVKLTCVKEFAWWCSREFEPLRRFDLVQPLQDSIGAVRPLWLVENIETAEQN